MASTNDKNSDKSKPETVKSAKSSESSKNSVKTASSTITPASELSKDELANASSTRLQFGQSGETVGSPAVAKEEAAAAEAQAASLKSAQNAQN